MKQAVSFISALLIVGLFLSPAYGQEEKKDADEKGKEEQVAAEFMDNVWKNVNKLTKEKRSFEVEKATTVAGVRGKEAEDEALSKLYFKGGENYPSRVELQQAVKILKEQLKDQSEGTDAAEIKYYIAQCQIQLGDKEAAAKTYDDILAKHSDSKWAKLAREGKKELGS